MNARAFVITVLMFVFAIAGLAIKVNAAITPPAASDSGRELGAHLERQGFAVLDWFPLSNRGPFILHIVRIEGCHGELAILPLPRNAEAEDLLERHIRPTAQVSFWLDGEKHPDFPELGFWLAQKRRAAESMFGLHTSRPNQVFATAETGNCQLAARVNWHALSAPLPLP